jgi:flagellar hook protein FlgE
MPSFSIPLSGSTASSTALSTIANNLANLNTVGYKQMRVTFRDLFYQTIGSSGSGNPLQIGAGTAVGSIDTNYSGNNIESSGVPTDVAINGDGFFVVSRDGGTFFTRAGNFSVNPEGLLETEDGMPVLGYPARNGVVDVNAGLGVLQVGRGQMNAPSATTKMHLKANLDATAAIGETFTTPVNIHDSLGASHILTFEFTKTGVNAWSYQVKIPAADLAPPANATVASGALTFDGDGKLVLPAGDVAGITITGLTNGASDVNFTWNLRDDASEGFLTQLASPFAPSATYEDGYGPGSLLEFSIGPDGTIQGAFNNGVKVLGQVALAGFANLQGLQRVGRNMFNSTLASGAAVIGQPGTGGRGTLSGGALELSNVDIAQEFAKLILAQRGFQANARAITTFDEITQETINLKR